MKSMMPNSGTSPLLVKTCVIVLAVISTAFVLSWTPQVRATARSIGFVAQVLPMIPVKPAEWVTGTPERIEITYPLDDGSTGLADLYVPAGGGRHSALLFFLGVNPAGKDDERVVNLGNAVARTGIVVMIPWSERMAERRITEQEIDDLVSGFKHLSSLDVVDSENMGMAGFCVGASLMLVAAQDERIRQEVRIVNSFAGYYEARDLIASVAAKRRFYDEESSAWEPDKLSVEVVRTHLLESIGDEGEREATSLAIKDGAALPEGLSSEARLVYDILHASDLEEAQTLISQLPGDSLDTLRRISPGTEIENLHAKLLVMHDRNDGLVPSEESRRLAEALRSRGDVHYTEFSFFDHLDPSSRVSYPELAREAAKLFAHIYRIMAELD